MKVDFKRLTWENYPSTETPINADNLNRLEEGVAGLYSDLRDIEQELDGGVGEYVTDWLNEHVDPVGSAVVVDNTLSIEGAAADAKKVGDEILGSKVVVDDTLSIEGAAADAKKTGDELTSLKEDLIHFGGGTTGQILRKKSGVDYDTEWVNTGTPTDEQVEVAVDAWLNEHPEATTTVQDGAITEQKLNSNFLPNIFNGAYTIKSFTGDLGTAVNNAFVNNNTVIVPANSTYYSYSVKIIVPSGKTLVALGEIRYSGTDAALEIIDSLYSKIYVHTIFAQSGSCIRVKSTNGLCEFNEIHSRYLYGKIGIEIISTGTSGVQHCNFYSNYIRAAQYGISIIAEQQNAWCGEIKFFGGEINGLNAIGVYTRGELTALRMFGVGFESLSNILDTENSNEINLFGCRSENAGKYIFRGAVMCVTIEGDYYAPPSIDIENLEATNGIVFRGAVRNASNGNVIGTELYVSPTLKVFAKGPMPKDVAYRYYNSDGTTIGGDNIFPRVARLVGPANGTYKLSDAYSIGNLEEIIIYAEKSGIKLTNADGTKVLFTTTDAQSVWRVTAADNNSYFSPSGYIVEKITPVK